MIDVSSKFNTLRYARAEGYLKTNEEIIERIKNKTVPKGDVLEVARAAGIMAGKKTSDTIVFCHPIPIDWIGISYEFEEKQIKVIAELKAIWKTGVEMEAMHAVTAVLLNMYDMLKPLTDDIYFGDIKLIKKKGGKSDFQDSFAGKIKTAVLVISDSTFEGTRKDKSGLILKEFLTKKDIPVECYEILPDIKDKISRRLVELVDEENYDLIITTGGTGLGPKDLTPEATRPVIDKEIPGIAETIRRHGKERTPFAMLSRECVGVRKNSIIVNLPGSSRGAQESIEALFPGLLHAYPMIWGGGHKE